MLRRYYTTTEIAHLRLADNKIYGAPAASLSNHSKNLNNTKGFYGEAIVGNILNLLAVETPGAYVCHSVAFEDHKSGESDHVFIYRDRIILVETKAFSGHEAYRVNKEGVLTAAKKASQKGRKANDSNVFRKVAHYQELFPNRKVQAILAITRDNVKTWSENGAYKVVSLDNIMTTIRSIMAEAEELKEPAWAAVKTFATMCMKPVNQEHSTSKAISPDTSSIPIIGEHQKQAPRRNGNMKYANRPSMLRHS